MKTNTKTLVIALGCVLLVICMAAFFILKGFQHLPGTPPSSSSSIDSQGQSPTNKSPTGTSRPTIQLAMDPKTLEAVFGVLKVTVRIENLSDPKKVEYSVDDQIKLKSETAPFSVDLDTASFSIGKHTLKAVAYDSSNKAVAAHSLPFTTIKAGTRVPSNVSAGGTGSSGSVNETTPQISTPDGGTTPAPDPVSNLVGWQLSSTNTGLAPHGFSCGSLPVYSGGDKPAAGSFISQKRITTPLDLSAGGITIEKSCIRPTGVGQGLPLITTTDYNNCPSNSCAVTPTAVTIRDSEIDGSLISAASVAHACAFLGIGNIERNYVHGVGSGICMFNTGTTLSASIKGNYVHNLRAFGDPSGSGSHNEAFTIRDFPTNSNPARRMNISNNRFDASSGNDTGAAFIQTYGGDINQVLFEQNLFEGQGYQLALEAGFGNIYGTSMRVVNNRFSGTGYGVGYVTRAGLAYGWSEWTNNYINNIAAADNRGSVAGQP